MKINTLTAKIKGALSFAVLYLGSFFKEYLPVGRTGFDKWAGDVIRLSKVPDNRSTRFALSQMVLHNSRTKFSKQFFVQQLNKAAANEVSFAVMQEIKAEQKAEAEATDSKVTPLGQKQ